LTPQPPKRLALQELTSKKKKEREAGKYSKEEADTWRGRE
jgi:hypothetical protein